MITETASCMTMGAKYMKPGRVNAKRSRTGVRT